MLQGPIGKGSLCLLIPASAPYHLCRFDLKTEAESSIGIVIFLNKIDG